MDKLFTFEISKKFLWSLLKHTNIRKIYILTENTKDSNIIAKSFISSIKFSVLEIQREKHGCILPTICQQIYPDSTIYLADGHVFFYENTIQKMNNVDGNCFVGAKLLEEPYISYGGKYGSEIRETWIKNSKYINGNFLYKYLPNLSPLINKKCYDANVVSFKENGFDNNEWRLISEYPRL